VQLGQRVVVVGQVPFVCTVQLRPTLVHLPLQVPELWGRVMDQSWWCAVQSSAAMCGMV
jgi:hypothetical protein